MTLQLRDYQQSNYDDIQTAWQTAQNVLYVAPCRSGKTVVMSKAILDNKGASICVAHRGELIQQMSLTLARRGIQHHIIGPASLVTGCRHEHIAELGRSFVSPHARCYVASAQTLLRYKTAEPWIQEITLWITDEGHHYYVENSWTNALTLFKNARGLSVTATPIGAGGKGLGRHADGLIDAMVVGPQPRELIKRGYLTDYRIFAPPNDIDLSSVTIATNGDYSAPKLSAAVHKSHITGDIVQHYIKVAAGKLGMTFAVDIEAATEIAAAYRAAGVPAEVVSGKTPDALRRHLRQQHQRGEILQLVSVDLFGEGIDVPKLEVVSFGRPTQSLGLYIQQFWRPGNPSPDKPHFIVLDHVGNVMRHGLPDAPREWTLDRRERRTRDAPTDAVPVRVCAKCLSVYERVYVACPFCNEVPVPATRSAPEAVDGDLAEMDEELLARLRGEIAAVDAAPKIPYGAAPVVVASIHKRHRERIEALNELKRVAALWGGWRTAAGDSIPEQQRRFYLTMGTDVLSMQSLGRAEAEALSERVRGVLVKNGVDTSVSNG